ncbi:beta-ketoacyl synthase N-terminal-like domain-containing protein [Microbulbifer spongiae]|uniref:Polyketide synthase dehydratase domain-containing protein n=1 Tax=Microbulbifer spongiae TaxID=2944933 RepID=A0ABY9E9Z5_9GAMM|nr:beta-ketoacyl synthase N-terminal-like domain-containing protein [Microbulbifer sp. MI-G]WKD49181.1 polyketide synthase dehydratase domain-containing protein [Microbulbifer sp. MI-G]
MSSVIRKKVVIVGAGLSGICMGIALKQRGIDFVILEKTDTVAGTWSQNRYPGCGCDIPMFAYCYSFEQFVGPAWPKQPLILDYFERCVDKYGLGEHIIFHALVQQAAYNDERSQWQVTCKDKRQFQGQYLVNGTGQLNTPFIPQFKGMESFCNPLHHSAQYPQELDLSGCQVGVIGNGASALQVIEALQSQVESLCVFARSAKYIFPRVSYSDITLKKMAADPQYWQAMRQQFFDNQDGYRKLLDNFPEFDPFDANSRVAELYAQSASVNFSEFFSFYQWLDQAGLRPGYPTGCSRPLASHTYHQALRQPNVQIITDTISHFNSTAIHTYKSQYPLDAVIFATGFQLNNLIPPYQITDSSGNSLEQAWQHHPVTYLGISTPGFPNLFFLYGPNTNTNSSSVTEFVECQVDYICRLIELQAQSGSPAIEVRREVSEEYYQWVQHRSAQASENAACSSWYKNADNINISTFPGGLREYQAMTAEIQLEKYRSDPAPGIQPDKLKLQQLQDIVIAAFSDTTLVDISEVCLELPLREYPLDSILIVEFVKRLNSQLGVELQPSTLFDFSNLKELSTSLGEQLKLSESVTEHLHSVTDSSRDSSPIPAIPQRLIEKWTRQQPVQTVKTTQQPVAIIGAHGYFPQARGLDELWQKLAHEVDCIEQIPATRWDWQSYWGDPKNGDKTQVKWGGFINGIDQFDPLFFKMSPKEAELMDPQHRLFLQCTWELLECAGYNPNNLSGEKIGVILGINLNDYAELVASRLRRHDVLQMSGLMHLFAANRLSYLFGFTGPSEVIDTACSSSLVAVHRAVQSIRQDNCEMVVAGGANLIITPKMHLLYSKAGMLAQDGRCKTFSAEANGYVRGEGIAAVLLKPLAKAERDGDHIAGVIIGSSENHGGKANSLTAPNPNSQAKLVVDAFNQAGIDPATISYVECHGTGTALGDPIEINGLKKAFKQLYRERNIVIQPGQCGLGSIKSNIGHLETAAGVAGLCKVLLAMQYSTLPGTLHCKTRNPQIELQDSPFYIVDHTQKWQSPVVNGRERPRRACVSSFGAGGTNAHLIVEQYLSESPAAPQEVCELPIMVVLSAGSEFQLQQYAEKLLHFVTAQQKIDLHALAYTLLTGREAMKHRLAVLVSSVIELKTELVEWLNNRASENCLTGNRDSDYQSVEIFNSDHELATTTNRWLRDGNFTKLAKLWVKGLDFDWQLLFQGNNLGKIVLPTYPFNLQSYWLGEPGDYALGDTVSEGHFRLHPMLHRNTSNLHRQCYRSVFTGNETFLNDHHLATGPVLPAVAYLEMAREALALALAETPGMQAVLQDVVWHRPIIVGQDETDIDVEVSVQVDPQGKLSFSIARIIGQQDQLCCSGHYILHEPEQPETHALPDIIGLMTVAELSAKLLYTSFAQVGLQYGMSHRTLKKIRLGHGQALAEILLPKSMQDSLDQYMIQPGIVDAAFQATNALLWDFSDLPAQPALPFALTEAMVLRPCCQRMFAWIRSVDNTGEHSVNCFDIDLLDESGVVCIRLRGLTTRTFNYQSTADDSQQLVLFQPQWAKLPKLTVSEPTSEMQCQLLLMADGAIDTQQLTSQLSSQYTIQTVQLRKNTVSNAEQYQQHVLIVTELLKSLLSNTHSETMLQLVIVGSPVVGLVEGISALLKTINREQRRLRSQLLELPQLPTATEFSDLLSDGLQLNINHLKWQQQRWYQPLWQQTQPAAWQHNLTTSWMKEAATYVVTGGLGKIGRIICNHLLTKADSVQLVLVGRSELNSASLGQLQELEAKLKHRQSINYRVVDLTDRDGVTALFAELSAVKGIFHCAGTTADRPFTSNSSSDLIEVMLPKTLATENLDLASAELDLDFIALFSSVTAALGNINQSNYALANGYLDGFAGYRNQLFASGQRRGITVSINWSLWQQGGIQVEDSGLQFLRQQFGMSPMPSKVALEVLHLVLTNGMFRLMTIYGNVMQIGTQVVKQQQLSPLSQPARSTKTDSKTVVEKQVISEKSAATELLRQLFAAELKLPAQQIDSATALEKYGIDSILAMTLTQKLEQQFGTLPKTLFFEYHSLNELADFLQQYHGEKIITSNQTVNRQAKQANDTALAMVHGVSERRGFRLATPLVTKPAGNANRTPEPVAIVGLSGRYPGSDDVMAYWKHLSEGKDCIVEVPRDRWRWQDYYSEDRTQSGAHYSRWGGFISGVDQFDPRFFGISPREAEILDPQERLFLQTAWHALEDAGYTRDAVQIPHADDLPGQVGVYVGIMYNEYQLFGAENSLSRQRMGIASSVASIANRVSYFLNVHGPSMTLDTMCSASLTAIHLALQDLQQLRTDLAIAGGVNVTIHPNKYLMLSAGQFISSTGQCQSFGEGGDGYIPGEGVGAVILKRLSEAEQQGNHIYGVLLGSALNHGGKTNGFTVPNPKAQGQLIKRALRNAQITPAQISYVEAHGTGTKLGDPIEIAALNHAFAEGIEQRGQNYCLIGSAKSNIGHCESAAGIAGLTKVLMQLQHQQVVPSLHSQVLNPHIDFASSAFVVNQQLTDWQRPVIDGKEQPRIATISSFGAGGSNANMVIQEYQPSEIRENQINAQQQLSVEPVIVPLSARNPMQLQQKVVELIAFIESRQETLNLHSLAYTLQTGREVMTERLGLIVISVTHLVQQLREYLKGAKDLTDVYSGQVKQNVLSAINQDEDMQLAVERWIASRKLSNLLDLWVKGLQIDWDKFYPKHSPLLISLPGYPFAQERYWVARVADDANLLYTGSIVHPLLQANVSDLKQLCFSSSGALLYRHLTDSATLPQAWSLSLVMAAVQCSGLVLEQVPQLLLSEVEFGGIPDLQLGNIRVALMMVSKDQGVFEIYSSEPENNRDLRNSSTSINKERIWSQGKLLLNHSERQGTLPPTTQEQSLVHKKVHLRERDNALLLVDWLGQVEALLNQFTNSELILASIAELTFQQELPVNGSIMLQYPSETNLLSGYNIYLLDSQERIFAELRGVKTTVVTQVPVADKALRTEREPATNFAHQATVQSADNSIVVVDFSNADLCIQLDSHSAFARKNNVASPLSAVTNRAKPVNIQLPAQQRFESPTPILSKPAAIQLAVLSEATVAQGLPLLQVLDHGAGVFSINLQAGILHDELQQALSDSFAWLSRQDVTVLLIATDPGLGLQGDLSQARTLLQNDLPATIAKQPTIFINRAQSFGAAWLLAASCDWVLYADNGRFSLSDLPLLPAVRQLLAMASPWQELNVTGGEICNARKLADTGWGHYVSKQTELSDQALSLAVNLSEKSPQALVLLHNTLAGPRQQILSALGEQLSVYSVKMSSNATNDRQWQPEVSDLVVETAGHALKLRVTTNASDAESVIKALLDFLNKLKQDDYHSQLLLCSDAPGFLPALTTLQDPQSAAELLQEILACRQRVICMFSGNIVGFAWLIGMAANTVIYPSGASFRLSDPWTTGVGLLLSDALCRRHLGEQHGRMVLFSDGQYSTEQLQLWRPDLLVLPLPAGQQLADKLLRTDCGCYWELTAINVSLLRSPADQSQREPAVAKPEIINLASTVITAALDDQGVAVITMQDEASKNLFTEQIISGLSQAFTLLAERKNCKVVVLTGYDNYFSSGGSKETLKAIQQGQARFTDRKVFALPMECPLPVVAAMQGHAIGAGWMLGMFADLSIFSKQSHYISPYINYGFTPGAGSTRLLPRKLGTSIAGRNLMAGDAITGETLAQASPALLVASRAETLTQALTLAQALAKQFSKSQLRALKKQWQQEVAEELQDGFAQELAMHQQTFVGNEQILGRIEQQFTQQANVNHQVISEAFSTSKKSEQNVAADQLSIQQRARQLLATELHLDPDEIDDHSQFIDLGLDSITAVTWIKNINKQFDLGIEASQVYNYPNLAEFYKLLAQSVVQQAPELYTAPPATPDSFAPVTETLSSLAPLVETTNNNERQQNQPALSALRQLLAEELHLSVSEIEDDAQFIDLGMDSITGVTWMRKVNEHFSIEIEATRIYSYPTLADMHKYLASVTELNEPEKVTASDGKNKLSEQSVIHVAATRPNRALQSIRSLVQKSSASSVAETDGIAIIGMAGQFAMAQDIDSFWQNILDAKNCISEVPEHRWNSAVFYQDKAQPDVGKTNSKWMGVLDDYDKFDPLFFNISPVEAESMDPQQRLFLQTSWHSIEHAGYNPESLADTKVGIFVGCGSGDYQQFSLQQLTAQGFTGGANSILAARIAYYLNFKGPCLSIDTACSSSLVAIASACESLTANSCDMALAGGVYVMSGPAMHIKTAQSGMLSRDGRCFTFDQRANGFVPGEGVGVVLLKRLQQARADNDHIFANIIGWGTNQDGKTNGITSPSAQSQAQLEQQIYRKFAIDPRHIGLIEAHGTGTKLGDPIEVEGLKTAFAQFTDAEHFCALGSVKSNIGHSVAAAGVAGVIKVVQALQQKILPPSINFTQINEHIHLSGSPFYVNTQARPWPLNPANSRMAAVSSFGFSGSNAHLVLEQGGQVTESIDQANKVLGLLAQKFIVPLSAKTEIQLQQSASQLDAFIEANPELLLAELAAGLQIGRAPMIYRLAIVCSSKQQLQKSLSTYLAGADPNTMCVGSVYQACADKKLYTKAFSDQNQTPQQNFMHWLQQGAANKIAEAWCQGMPIDWKALYPLAMPNRVTLPLYPFAKESYWQHDNDALLRLNKASSIPVQLHPLLHRNESDLQRQCYTTTLMGTEWFLTDHKVQGQSLLPGVAYLEMALNAAKHALGELADEQLLQLNQSTWIRSLVVTSSTEIITEITPVADSPSGNLQLEVHIKSTTDVGLQLLFQSNVVVIPVYTPADQNVAELTAKNTGNEISGTMAYQLLQEMGLQYGTSHQGIVRLSGDQKQILAELALPSVVTDTINDYLLHPSIMDSALQSSFALIYGIDTPNTPSLPFSIDSLIVHRSTEQQMLALITREGPQDNSGMVTMNIDLLDVEGRVCVECRGFVTRNTAAHNSAQHNQFDLDFYQQVVAKISNNQLSIAEAVDMEII